MPTSARTVLAFLVTLCLLGPSAQGQCGTISVEGAALQPHPDGRWFGRDVSTDGHHLAVALGSVTDVYRRTAGGWVRVQQLAPADAAAVSGEWLVTGRSGVLLVHRLVAGLWIQWQEIPRPDGVSQFGWAVDLRGETLAAGSSRIDLYAFDEAAGQWTAEATLLHPVERLALGDGAVAFCNDGDAGAYRCGLDGSWIPLLLSPPPTAAASAAFDGQSLLIGNPFANDTRGEVYVYERVDDGFAIGETLTLTLLQEAAAFGAFIAVDEGVLAIGATAASWWVPQPTVYAFTRSGAGWNLAGVITDIPTLHDLSIAEGQLAGMSDAGAVSFSPGISDFDANGVLDRCDVAGGTYADMDCDHTPDVSPLDFEHAADCDGDGLPDTCSPFNDCDTNRVPDHCQLALGLSTDCNGNGRLDSCDTTAASDPSQDCNGNGIPDECDLSDGTSLDCNNNDTLDECECSINMGCSLVHFTDVTAEAGLDAAGHKRGYHYGGAGGATADFNNDGWQDIYFGAGENPDQLYINNGDGTFRNATAAWGLLPGNSQGAAVADYDGNGWLDVFVGGGDFGRPSRLYRNNGDTTFTDVAAAAGVQLNINAGNAAWGDYDRDGDLDLVVSHAGTSSDPNANTIFRNNRDGTFTDVTVDVRVGATMRSDDGCGVRLFDFDGDGWQDLLWMSRFGQYHYYASLGGGLFQERPGAFGQNANVRQGSGLALGDFDEDGDFDLSISTSLQPLPTFFRNDGGHAYSRVPPPPPAPSPHWQMAAAAIDADHDTRPDLVITTKLDGQFLYHNTGAPRGPIEFNNVSQCTEFIADVSGRGLATFDYDNDGDRDVILFPHDDSSFDGTPPVLLRNDLTGPETNWICIFLDTSAAADIPPNGIGSVVKLRLGTGPDARTLMNFIDGGSNYLSQSELSAHFGLAGATMIDEIVVEWTNGTTTTLANVSANQTLTIAAPPCAADLDANAVIDVFDLLAFLDVWFSGDADFDGSGATDLFDLIAFVDAWFEGC